ncbi:hypothetical protein [Actinokineospora globicatena]|uniref:Uncharacterized protein n=1 Tax=Actinokineospora globicatena TaxID=103729 RepID=A0A9W6QKN2_9PSEU|nr:hypothetical protein [Actinokineospora globicatena]MCP2301349.1 hypothetical protein [Actinokineospora globicatena]GLW77012.1 hypothetical protein Aglo01_14940 [Actinokineospora globicatena]GLW83846.1 hypothetical protein Aglo02_14860 [Actinokineospora globicatena]GLW92213.1 hypothetical protein Aglo03_30290 [Actinokineospora globicatena]
MTYQRPRTGIIALLDGREYPATSPERGEVTLTALVDPVDPRFTQTPTGWQAVVALDSLDRLDEVTTRADHLGHECLVVGISPEGSAGLYYVGPDKSKASTDGFVQIDPGTWAKNTPIATLTNFREHHTDLLFATWLHQS